MFDTAPTFKTCFPAGLDQVREALVALDTDLAAQGETEGDRGNIQIVLSEVLNNVVEHAYRGAPGADVDLGVWRRPEGLWAQTWDYGVELPNGELPPGDFPDLDGDDLPEGGFGWALVLAVAREVSYCRVDDRNVLRLLIPFE